jgi:hypothetical protein
MSRLDKGKSKYQLKVERNDPNFLHSLRSKALTKLGSAIDRGDIRAILAVLEATNALKPAGNNQTLSADLAQLLQPAQPTEAAAKAPGANLAIASPTQIFPDSGSHVPDSTGDSSDTAIDEGENDAL